MLHTLPGGPASGIQAATRQSPARCGAGPCYSRVPVLSPLRMRQSAADCILSLRCEEPEWWLVEKIV
eukprot:1181816-Prorocentrum_minimum.AAC.2